MTLKIKRSGAPQPSPAPAPAPSPQPSPAPSATVRPLVPPRAPKSAKNSARVLMSVLDGKIEWEKMTAEARKSFQDLFKDKEFLSQFGLTGKEQIFEPEQMKALYDGISMMYQTVVGMVLRWPPEALKLLAYSADQKEMLAKPTAKLASKLAPAILVKHQELFIWGSLFASITQANFLKAKSEAAKMIAAQQPRRPGNAPVMVTQRPPNGHDLSQRAAEVIMRPNAPAPADQPAPPIQVPFSVESASLD